MGAKHHAPTSKQARQEDSAAQRADHVRTTIEVLKSVTDRLASDLAVHSDLCIEFCNRIQAASNEQDVEEFLSFILHCLEESDASASEDHGSDLSEERPSVIRSPSVDAAQQSESRNEKRQPPSEENGTRQEDVSELCSIASSQDESCDPDNLVHAGGYTVLAGPWYLVNAHENNGCEHLLLSTVGSRKRQRTIEPDDHDHRPTKKSKTTARARRLEKENAQVPSQVGTRGLRLDKGAGVSSGGRGNDRHQGTSSSPQTAAQAHVHGVGADPQRSAAAPTITGGSSAEKAPQHDGTVPQFNPQPTQDPPSLPAVLPRNHSFTPINPTSGTQDIPVNLSDKAPSSSQEWERDGRANSIPDLRPTSEVVPGTIDRPTIDGASPSQKMSGGTRHSSWVIEDTLPKTVGVDKDPAENHEAIKDMYKRSMRSATETSGAHKAARANSQPLTQAPAQRKTVNAAQARKARKLPKFPNLFQNTSTEVDAAGQPTSNTETQSRHAARRSLPQSARTSPVENSNAAASERSTARASALPAGSNQVELLKDSNDEDAGDDSGPTGKRRQEGIDEEERGGDEGEDVRVANEMSRAAAKKARGRAEQEDEYVGSGAEDGWDDEDGGIEGDGAMKAKRKGKSQKKKGKGKASAKGKGQGPKTVDTNRSEVGPDTKEGKTKADGLWIFGLKPSVSVAGDAR